MPTFAELFCERYCVSPDHYARAVFWRCVHRRALVFVPILRLLSPDYFAPDFELIRDAGRLTRASGLHDDLADFYSHPRNVGFVRRRLRLRISIGRLTRLVNTVMPPRSAPSASDALGTGRPQVG